MIKVIKTFKLEEDGNEEEAAIAFLDGWKWKDVLWDLDQYLRQISKYGSEEDNKKVDADHARGKIHEFLAERGLSFDR